MSEIKILHMADIHFGRPASGLPDELRDIRRQEVRSAFSAGISLAKEKNVDAVLIAGDLFDSPHADKSTLNFVSGEFSKISHIPVFVSPGNHDPIGSAYDYLVSLGNDNLTVFGSEYEVKELEGKNCLIHGIGFENEVVQESLIKNMHAEDEEKVNIALIHGEISASGEYNPMREAEIAKSGMDYVALGHVHAYSEIKNTGNTFYAYSGAIEGGGFDECGPKGVIAGTVSKGKCNLEFVPVCKRRYEVIEIDVSETASLQEIIEKAQSLTTDKSNLYKIVLTGKRPEKIPANVIENEVDAFFVKVKDLTRGAYNLQEISKDYTIGGIFAKNVLERMANATESEREKLLSAADIVMDILKG